MRQRRLPEWNVVVRDPSGIRLIGPLSRSLALSLVECCGEDPATWDDLCQVWPRYCFDAEQPASLEQLPRQTLTWLQARAVLAETEWALLDLRERQIWTSPEFPAIEWIWRDAADRSLLPASGDPDHSPEFFSVLPAWWQLRLEPDPPDLSQPSPRRPEPLPAHREQVWGQLATTALAGGILAAICRSRHWQTMSDEAFQEWAQAESAAIHRDWLLTPRSELEGASPRECLHQGIHWIDRLVQGQMPRVQEGLALLPLTPQFSRYDSAPPGPHEFIMYFHACRACLAAGWDWLRQEPGHITSASVAAELGQHLRQRLEAWWDEPFEGAHTPRAIVASERGRVPLISGQQHLLDCDCPLCQMLDEGLSGPAVIGFDGHELELEDDFAFSLCATREQWEEERTCSNRFEMETSGPWDLDGGSDEGGEPDSLASPWLRTWVAPELEFDESRLQLLLGFYSAEIVATLQQVGAPPTSIANFNQVFRRFRTAQVFDELAQAAQDWIDMLESFASTYPELESRSADLQSRVFERLRAMSGLAGDDAGDEDEDD